MFNSIRGTITERTEESLRLLSGGGIEWDITVSSRTARTLPEPGQEARVLIFLYHREDTMKLYGFALEEERNLFFDLMKVQGIGPRQSLKILSGMEVADFVSRLEAGDADSLAQIQGLGKKTAQKIILTLKGKLQIHEEESGGGYQDVVNALADMGYDRKECMQAVQKVLREPDIASLSQSEREREVFRRAIVALSS